MRWVLTLRGSGDFFAWARSCACDASGANRCNTAEHRGAPAPDPIALTLVGEDDDVTSRSPPSLGVC
ncbi:MAG: hypothetical protein HYV09_29280 [Deltaproteobacteria bacterium]|nr:hypothetical protein [Deltaproteobacteria bacterium]